MRVLDGGESVETEEETRDPETGELITGESSVTTAPPDPWQALVRYAILAEQGCEAAASNAGWLLSKKMAGFRGEYFDADHAALAIAMLERSAAMGNHESHVDMGNARWERVVSAGGPGGGTQSRPSGNEPAMTPAFDCERCGQFGTLGWLAPRGWIDDEDAEDKRGLGLRRVRVGRHTRPPAGLAPEEEVAWHYATASAAGVAEGTVSLAWAHVHGVGVPRNLTAASHMLSHAMHNAVDDEESVPAFFAWVGVEALQFAERWFLRPGALRGWYERSGRDSKRGERGQSRDHAGLGGGGHPVDDADEDAPGIGAEPGRKPSSPRAGLNDDLWFPFSWRVIENCLLLCLGALCLVVVYARRVLNDPGFDRDIVEQMPVGALAGVGAAIAVAAGVSVAVFGA
jgi:SEL1 protein